MTFKLFRPLALAFVLVCAAVNILFLLFLLPAPDAGAVRKTIWAVLALIPLDLALVLLFTVIADRRYVSIALKLSRDLDVEGFQKANAPVLRRLESHPELNHTAVGFAVRMNAACALAEAGDLRRAAEGLKAVLYEPAVRSGRRRPIYARALLHMARLLYCLEEPEGADRCVEELQRLRDSLTGKDGAAVQKQLRQLALRAGAARSAYEGRTEEALGLLGESGDRKDLPLETVRLTCLSAYARCLAGDEPGGRAALDRLGPGARGLFACAETRRRCGFGEGI